MSGEDDPGRLASQLARNLAEVRGRIADAARSAGRQPEEVRLIAVTKYVGVAEIRALVAAGCHELGEARPQDLWSKAAALASKPIEWHLIGHLQRNKARRTLPLVKLIHSVDSLRLMETIDAESRSRLPSGTSEVVELDHPVPVLLEINISGDEAKDGFSPGQVPAALEAAAKLDRISVRGLMGMAALEGGAEAAEGDFARLRELRDRLVGDCPAGVSLAELSMGMSGDYEIAIRHGATMVRVGSALFEGIS